MTGRWWQSETRCLELAYWLEDRGDLRTAMDAIAFFDAPWKWDAEWRAMQAERAAERAPVAVTTAPQDFHSSQEVSP